MRFNDAAPWPQAADGLSNSLERVTLTTYADDLANWRASADVGGTPGSVGPGDPVAPSGFDAWVDETFTTEQQAAFELSANADADKDGYSNFIEYVLNRDLLAADNTVALIVSAEGNQITLAYDLRPDIPTVSVSVEMSADLVTWAPATIASTDNDANSNRVTQRLPLEGQVRFLRLKAGQ